MTKKIQMMSHDKEWQVVDGVETLVPVEQFDIDPVTDSSCVKIEGFRTLEETLNEKNMFTPEVSTTKVMDKVGGEYHQSVVDGAYEEAILYGNTQVNLCEEDTSVALQIPTTFTSFNNSELQINNKENQVVAPLIKGVTMVNLAQTNSVSLASSESFTIENVKGNTLYTLSFKFTTKNTNSGVTIESYNGDTYLENTMHKTGLGDVVKFTFTTHANATKIHICNNAAYGGETIQLDEIMLIEGDQTALDIPFFKGMKSVELVRPLTNLFANDTPTAHSFTNVTNNNGQVTATSQSSATWTYACFNITFKSNTSYIVMWDSLSYTQTGNANQTIAICYGNDIIANIDNNFTNKRSIIFNTGDKNPSDINLRIHATTKNTETGTTTVTGLRVFEYDDYLRSVDLQSIGWFSGTKNVAVEPIKTCSKNLYPYGDISFTSEFADSWCDAKGNAYMTGDIALKSKSRFLLKKGTYCFSHNGETNISALQIVDDKENLLYNPITLKQDTYCTVRVKTINANTLTTVSNIQIERGKTATDYVIHDSRYYEPNGQNAIVLRSLPSGVCDTFNLQTGEYTRRIGEVVLNGSEEWRLNKPLGDGSFNQFVVNRVQAKKVIGQLVACDKLISDSNENKNNVIWIYDGTTIVIHSSCTSKDEFKTWLQQNPLTVQYEFREPSTTIIPRTIKRNNNGTVSTVDFKTYTNKESLRLPSNPSYLTINSMTSIKPVVEPITYIDFKTRLKTNTNYSVIIDKDSINKTINLGGTAKTYADKMLVRTPSINLEQNLRISGSGSIQNIMVIEGDVLDKELPYFNGMCNVKMPIIKNCGRNLFNTQFELGTMSSATGVLTSVTTAIRAIDYIKIIGGKQYVFYCDNPAYKFAYVCYDANKKFLRTNGAYSSGTVIRLGSDVQYVKMRTPDGNGMNDVNVKLAIYEYDESVKASYEPYKGNDIYLVQGEIGLSQDMFESGGYGTGNGGTKYEDLKYVENSRTRIKTYLRVKPSTSYRLTYDGKTKFNHREYDINGAINGTFSTFDVNDKVFTTQSSTEYITMLIECSYSSFNVDYLQLLELDSTVQLRSLPNGVKDELNLLTGEYIQRIGEVVLDGSQSRNNNYNGVFDSVYRIGILHSEGEETVPENHVVGYCDKLNNIHDWEGDYEHFYVGKSVVMLYINKEKIGKLTDENIKAYLSQNPITVQYELAEPIISYPRIVSNTQEREVGIKLPNGVCDTYNPSTGITVKRVGKVILDGSENWLIDAGYTPTANLIRMSIKQPDKKLQYNNGDLVCDKLPVVQQGVVPCIYDRWNEYLYVDVKSSDIGVTFGTDNNATIISKFKTWLNANPITVYYELKYPQVTTDIVIPTDIHDEYNPITGLYTKRVGLTEFDGSDDENWIMHSSVELTNTAMFTIPSQYHNTSLCAGMCDKFAFKLNWTVDEEGCYLDSSNFCLRVAKSKLATVDLQGLKTYLSQNPVKLWYALQTPQKIQLTPYFGLPMPYAYQGGHLIMDSAYDGVSLPPEFKYRLIANRTGQVNQNNIKLQQHTTRLSNLEAMLVDATLQSMYEREMMAFNLEMVNINLINLEE